MKKRILIEISPPAMRCFGRQQGLDAGLQYIGEGNQFEIRHATQLSFDLRQRGAAHVQSANSTSCCQHLLRQASLVAKFSNLRSDDVLRPGHAPDLELDLRAWPLFNCSGFGAI